MWADPKTCKTVRSSGLPVGRRVSVYCFAPPCITDPNLSHLSSKLIVSFVYSHDVVSRLSLGSVRDIKNAAMWLCDANDRTGDGKDGSGYTSVTQRARQWKAGWGSNEDPDWVRLFLRLSIVSIIDGGVAVHRRAENPGGEYANV